MSDSPPAANATARADAANASAELIAEAELRSNQLSSWKARENQKEADLLDRLVAALKASEERRPMCAVCAGTGKPLSGKPCICGGRGTQEAELQWFREEHAREMLRAEAAEINVRVARQDAEAANAALRAAEQENAALRARVKELEADERRMGWLESAVPSGTFRSLSEKFRGEWHGSFRDWIDAAQRQPEGSDDER